MTIEHIHEFVAIGEIFQEEVSVPVVIKGSYQRYGTETVQCTVMLDNQNLPTAKKLSDSEGYVGIRGKTDSGKQIWIPKFKVSEYRQHREKDKSSFRQATWVGEAEIFLEGDLESFDATNGIIHYSILTNPTRLAGKSVMYWPQADGTLTINEGDERIPLQWETPIGKVKFSDIFHFTPGKAGIFSSYNRVRAFGITIERNMLGKTSLKTLLTEMWDSFESAFLLISFLSRKRVGWYEAEVIYIPEENSSQDLRSAIARRPQWFGFETTYNDNNWYLPLVSSTQISGTRFEETLARFDEFLKTHDFFKTIIFHLLMSNEQGYIESLYTNAYTALECLVANLAREKGIDTTVDDEQFSQLKQNFKSVIKKQFEGNENKALRASLYPKVFELRRRSFADTLLLLINEYDLNISRLWPPNTDITEAIKNMVRRRNKYIHEGKVTNHQILVYDRNRIQNLVELWILKLLGWPSEDINSAHVGQSVPIKNREAPV